MERYTEIDQSRRDRAELSPGVLGGSSNRRRRGNYNLGNMTNLHRAAVAVLFLAASTVHAQATDFMLKQQRCAAIVEANMSTTARDKPAVMKTVMGYLFEYSPSHDTCVEVIQYSVRKPGKSHQVQVIAYNAVTQQPMKGYKKVFLEDASDTQAILDATYFLFDKYSY